MSMGNQSMQMTSVVKTSQKPKGLLGANAAQHYQRKRALKQAAKARRIYREMRMQTRNQ